MVAVGVRVLVVCVGVLALGWHSDARLVLRGRRQVAEASCSVVSERSATIIQTKQSLAAGAEFLVAPDVSDQDDCLSACCNTPSCNTAIVKHKVHAQAVSYDHAIGRNMVRRPVTGTFVPTYFCFQERKFHRWNFRSMELLLSLELLFQGTFVQGTLAAWNISSRERK